MNPSVSRHCWLLVLCCACALAAPAADARSLDALGFTVVRLGIIWQGLEPGPPDARPNDPRYCARHRAGTAFPSLGAGDPYRPSAVRSYLARTDRIVALLADAGLRVILDMHQDAFGSAFSETQGPSPWNGEGAPAWATCTGGAAFDGRPYWGLAYTAPAVQTAIRHFWLNDVRGDLQGQFARVWQAVARHYRRDRDVLGYEVFNEPRPGLLRRARSASPSRCGSPVSCSPSMCTGYRRTGCSDARGRCAWPPSARRSPGSWPSADACTRYSREGHR